jgi:hypothetical protein
MKKVLLYFGELALALTICTACSNNSLTVNEDLDKTIFDSENNNTELGMAIDSLYNKYGSKVMYKFKSSDIAFGWSSTYALWYIPVPDGCDKEVLEMTRFIKDDVYTDYPDALVKKYLPSRIFYTDSLSDYKYDDHTYPDFVELHTHGIVISNVAPRMSSWTSDNWSKLKSELLSPMLNGIYDTNKALLSDFMDGKDADWFIMYDTDYSDPTGKYDGFYAGLFTYGYANADMSMKDWGIIMRPSDSEDLGYFLSFLFKTSKSDMDYIFKYYPRMKKRAFLLAKFVKEVLELDPVSMQNATCPSDPVPAGYFDNLNS